jgi:hypothetical protein
MNLDPTLVVAALFAALPLLLLVGRIRFEPDGTDLADLFTRQDDLAWPRGVQEEDPLPWRLERLTPPVRQRETRARPAPRVSAPTAFR